jgi:1,4-dihydroxy-2-naphthoyl-CoA hydrolase
MVVAAVMAGTLAGSVVLIDDVAGNGPLFRTTATLIVVTASPANDDPTAQMHRMMPFTALLGATALRAQPDEVTLRLEWDATRCTSGGLLHGGALMALADAAGGWCAYLNLPEGATNTATVTSATNFLRPVTSGHVDAVARVLHAGRSTIVVDTELRSAQGELVARVTQTQAVLRAIEPHRR